MTKNQDLLDGLLALAPPQGKHPTRLEGVSMMNFTQSIPRCPVIYNPSIVFVAQGRKVGHLGDASFSYDADHYLVLSLPLPFECETHGPYLGLTLDVDPTLLAELLISMDDGVRVEETVPALASTQLTDSLRCSLVRLVASLGDPLECKVLGPAMVREIIFRVLQGPQGAALRAVANRHSQFSQIARALALIHSDFSAPLDVESLARKASMSVSAFHQKFKVVTSHSPLQYLKNIRLHKARGLMALEGLSASAAASQVGYQSSSQFSREYKRFFGEPPSRRSN